MAKRQTKKSKDDSSDSDILMDSENMHEDFIKAVGRLTLNFAHLEFCFMLFAGSQIGAREPLNQIVISELSFKQLLHVSAAIFKVLETDKDELAKFDKILKSAFELEQQRNTITHSFYGHSKKPKIIIRHKMSAKGKKGFKDHEEIIDSDTVNKIADRMTETSLAIKKMLFTIATV